MRCFCYSCWICNLVLMFMLSDVPVRLKFDSMFTELEFKEPGKKCCESEG